MIALFDNLLCNANYRKKFITFKENGIHYELEIQLRKKVLTLDGVYVTPCRRGGLKALLEFLYVQDLDKIVIGKIINPHLAEYLAKEGWLLKANGAWIEFWKVLR